MQFYHLWSSIFLDWHFDPTDDATAYGDRTSCIWRKSSVSLFLLILSQTLCNQKQRDFLACRNQNQTLDCGRCLQISFLKIIFQSRQKNQQRTIFPVRTLLPHPIICFCMQDISLIFNNFITFNNLITISTWMTPLDVLCNFSKISFPNNQKMSP